jgi:O-antigen ligase
MNALLVLDRTALVATLLTPLLLMHAHGIAEGTMAITGVCFLIRSALTRDWGWLTTRWLVVGLVWWGWLVFCSLPLPELGLGEGGMHSLVQAIVTVRFLIFVAALEHVVLADPAVRRWLFGICAACVLWIESMVLYQWVFWRNIWGAAPAWGDVLTGPFDKPRAAAPLSRLLLPVLVPVLARLGLKTRLWPKLGAVALLLAALGGLILIGQTVPVLLVAFGLLICGVLLPRLRPAVLVTALGATLLVVSLPVVSPVTYDRLVERAAGILTNFPTTQYGELYARALEVGLRNPVTGMGYDGFATGCPMPKYFRPTFDGRKPDGGGAKICWVHPHNFYFQALTDGGLVGLALFCTLAAAWLAPLARGLWRYPDPMRVALFAVVFVQLWPVQSTTAFTSMPMGGWFFLLLGWAMAETRHSGPRLP